MKWLIPIALAWLLSPVFACAPRVTSTLEPQTAREADEERERNREALEQLTAGGATHRAHDVPVLPVTVLTPPPTAAEVGEGSIDRDELDEFLDGGPHRLLATVEVEPVMQDTAFQGFRVSLIHAEAGPLDACGLRLGDVITAVNGMNIGRPEGFMSAWDSMREADHLHIDIIRDGQARSLRWVITGG